MSDRDHLTTKSAPSPLDFDREWHRAAEENAQTQRISRNVVRTIYQSPRGSGPTDTFRLGHAALVTVFTFVMPRAGVGN